MGVDFAASLKSDIENSDIGVEDINLMRMQYFKKTNKLKIVIKSESDIDAYKQEEIKRIISARIGFISAIEIIVYKDISGLTLEQLVENHWVELTQCILNRMPLLKQCLATPKKEIDGESIKFYYGNSFLCGLLKSKNAEKLIKNTIEDHFGIQCSVKIQFDSDLEEQYSEKMILEEKKIIQNTVKEIKAKVQPVEKAAKPKYNDKNEWVSEKSENVIMGKNIREESQNIKEINQTSGVVAVSGDIFKTEIIETKTGRKIITFYITDYTSSIIIKCFPRPKDIDKVLEEIKNGLYCKVKGEAVHDSYAKEVVIMARDIMKLKKIERMDISEEKRVELHMHTSMSAMDAITSPSKLIERAAKWGHTAVAITDHGVVQAYPEAMDAAKKHNIKVLYGVEAYLVDDGIPMVTNPGNRSIDDEYVVFDIETTGFSCANDSIIEIGAVKIQNGKVIDTFSEFVNPNRRIPAKIVELTGITDSMVENAPKIEEVLKRFMEFIESSIVVAHNANFDVSFIKKSCSDFGFEFKNSVMDTIPLAKFLYPELKRYKLDVVAKHLGISMVNHHRAIDDARATAQIVILSFEKLRENNIEQLSKLNEECIKAQDIKKLAPYHIIIFAKNQIGLKNLYTLISKTHLDFFHKRPRMPKSLIAQYREGLILGSACEAGQVYKEILQGKSDDELRSVIDFYDYLEIQPAENNSFMIRNGNIKDMQEIKNINKRICTLGEKNKKLVVATCDVHFLDPDDEAFRRVIMAGQGFSDADNQAPLYFRTTNEMLKEFEYLGPDKAREVVITNPNKIADIIENIKPIPDETFPPKIEGADDDIRNMTMDMAHSIYGEVLPDVVEKRLDKELNSIISNGYAVLYLIAHKLVAKSLNDGYLVGSRGSVGSSLVATMTGITEVNGLPPHYVCPECKNSEFILDGSSSSGADLPDKNCPKCGALFIKDGHDIPFETFLGFEGDKEPDIDLNFSGDYQPVVHKYTEVLFGKGFVFKAGTIGTIAEKTAYGFVKKYLQERELVVSQAEIERLTIGCTGIKRTTGQHPGGIMVVPNDNDILNFTPIQHPADDNTSDIITTHFDYHSISGRLLKLDILGHDDPTVLRMLQDLTGLDPKTIHLNDPKVISLFTSPDALGITKEELECEVGTYGLPEFGTKFVRQMLLDTKPQSFADLVRISGLSHGTDVWINNAQYFIKEGFTTLKECIATRDDIMVYLMYKGVPPKIAFNIMEKVRKGKGLKDEDVKVMKENKVPDWYIESCNKIKYMFPKGHAVAYVMMAVRIAYFKVYYKEAYYAAYFTVRADDFDAELIVKGEGVIKDKMIEINQLGNNLTQKDKGLLTILEISYEMYKRGLKFLKVDIYKSDAVKFIIEEDGIRPPLKALAGVGENAAKSIVEVRIQGEFISKEELRLRAKVSKTVVETLSVHGCLEGMPDTNQLTLF